MRLTARDLIFAPFINCPSCHERQFGIAYIQSKSYGRRCKACLFPTLGVGDNATWYQLPPLNRKIVYLDQCALSSILKSVFPELQSRPTTPTDPRWTTITSKVVSLCDLQLVICPYSGSQEDESYVYEHYQPIKRLYKHLSHGISFYDHQCIKHTQLTRHALMWYQSRCTRRITKRCDALPAEVNDWQDHFLIDIESDFIPELAREIRNHRELSNKNLGDQFQYWQSQPKKSLLEWYECDIQSYGPNILHQFLTFRSRFRDFDIFHAIATGLFIHDNPELTLAATVLQQYSRIVGQNSEAIELTEEYLRSAKFSDIASVHVASLLLASLARRAACGQKRAPSRGMVTDILAACSILPYCDAMFLDNELCSMLTENDTATMLGYATRIFSLDKYELFAKYLDDIRGEASKTHIKRVKSLYGYEESDEDLRARFGP